jgi:hypothetical protein
MMDRSLMVAVAVILVQPIGFVKNGLQIERDKDGLDTPNAGLGSTMQRLAVGLNYCCTEPPSRSIPCQLANAQRRVVVAVLVVPFFCIEAFVFVLQACQTELGLCCFFATLVRMTPDLAATVNFSENILKKMASAWAFLTYGLVGE